MATLDLWPDEIATDNGLEGPAVILKEQAILLGQKTKNLVEAEIISFSNLAKKGEFIDGFMIVSPVLDYRYPLFQVNYPVEFFPALVVWDGFKDTTHTVGDSPAHKVNSREELEEELKVIFSDPKTVRIIQALISRSRS